MALLSFSVLEDKLLDGSKTQTIRANIDWWIKALYSKKTLKVWWKPRTKDRYKLGEADLNVILVKYGSEFDLDIAKADGFDSVDELIEALAGRHKISRRSILRRQWAILKFTWLDGYPEKGGNP